VETSAPQLAGVAKTDRSDARWLRQLLCEESDGSGGGGLAQWNASWYHGQGPHGEQSLDTFARSFETTYEFCSGVTGFMQVTPGSLCMDGNRRAYALAAVHQSGGSLTVGGTTAVPASFATGGACASNASFVGGGGLDPIPGFRPGRDDMGVDACGNVGEPIIAPAASTLVEIVPNWYQGQPLMLLHFNQPLPGTLESDQYWYVAEQVDPVTVQTPTVFQARQVVAHFAPTGTCIEIGWGDPTSTSRTLAGLTDPGAAHPPAGALTKWGETFKEYFGIPWVGRSP
jgi:hypothetical protein